MYKRTQRLGADKTYKKPDVTFQEQLSKEEIAEKLNGYEKVDNIMDVPINTHLRYFIFDNDGTASFRTGGLLQNKNNGDVYVVLSNGSFTWSVQVKTAQFYRKLTHVEELAMVHDAYQNKIDEQNDKIVDLKSQLKATSTKTPIKKVTNAKTETAAKTPVKKVTETAAKTTQRSKNMPPIEVELVETVRKPKKKIEKKTS
uniref:Uncharacterized protein n=1 Tax=viral metagenome TaxID=1070528 RepID=A0A6C0CB82_9ZZZZ